MSRIDEIKRRLEFTPEGEWYLESDGNVWVDHSGGHRLSMSGLTGALPIWAEGAAPFIANAPEDVRCLLDALDAVERLHAAWEHDAPDPLILLLVKRTREAITTALEAKS